MIARIVFGLDGLQTLVGRLVERGPYLLDGAGARGEEVGVQPFV